METVSVGEARRRFAEVVANVAFGGKRVLLERHGKPAAALISYADLLRLQELDRRDSEKESWRLALEKAEAAAARIMAERKGEYLPDIVEVIRQAREERTNEL